MDISPYFRQKLAEGLFYVNAVLWLIYSIVNFFQLGGPASDQIGSLLVAVLLILLMVGNATAMGIAGLLLRTEHPWAYRCGLALLGLNVLLTFTDQFGFFDGMTLMLDLTLAGLLISLWVSERRKRAKEL
jgi:hypothetical protein